jgi:hypothetical protein
MGPLEETLRLACWLAPDWEAVIKRLSPNMEMRDIIYGASAAFNDGEPLGISEILQRDLMPDVLTEAICFAEALDQEVETRSRPCPNCGEPHDPEEDCEFFGCNKCGKEICESCASGGMCEACDGKHNGTVTVRFK